MIVMSRLPRRPQPNAGDERGDRDRPRGEGPRPAPLNGGIDELPCGVVPPSHASGLRKFSASTTSCSQHGEHVVNTAATKSGNTPQPDRPAAGRGRAAAPRRRKS